MFFTKIPCNLGIRRGPLVVLGSIRRLGLVLTVCWTFRAILKPGLFRVPAKMYDNS